jgi:L-fucose mutarotase
MLKGQLLHPQILAALGRGGHSSKVLISDGNYPHWTRRGINAEMVYLNLAPGQLLVTDVLKALVSAIPIEAAEVMDYDRTGPYGFKEDPPVWNEYRQILKSAGSEIALSPIERFKFYDTAGGANITLSIATGDQRLWANLLLTIGVVK